MILKQKYIGRLMNKNFSLHLNLGESTKDYSLTQNRTRAEIINTAVRMRSLKKHAKPALFHLASHLIN